METLARVWRKMEDKLDEIAAKAAKDAKVIKEQQAKVSAALNKAMLDLKQSKATTAAGEIERKPQRKVSGKDWAAIYKFVHEHKAFSLLHKRLSSTFVEEWMKEHQDAEGNAEVPPGVSVFTEYTINVKKPGAKSPPKNEE